MISVRLTRFGSIPGMGTFGKLITDGFQCLTVEREWKQNLGDESCIPLGHYECQLYDSPRHGKVYQVMNVSGRSFIEIHPANIQNELKGCIALGNHWGTIGSAWGVLNSQKTVSDFMTHMEGEELLLIIERDI